MGIAGSEKIGCLMGEEAGGASSSPPPVPPGLRRSAGGGEPSPLDGQVALEWETLPLENGVEEEWRVGEETKEENGQAPDQHVSGQMD